MRYTLMMMIMMGSNLDLEVYAKCECNISSLLGKKNGRGQLQCKTGTIHSMQSNYEGLNTKIDYMTHRQQGYILQEHFTTCPPLFFEKPVNYNPLNLASWPQLPYTTNTHTSTHMHTFSNLLCAWPFPLAARQQLTVSI